MTNLAFGRNALKKVRGMTPARFDLLYALRRVAMVEPGWPPLDMACSQTELCKELGLHRSTVSKMLKRLEQMGWIRRARCPVDGRTFNVGLTAKGFRKIWHAMRRILGAKIVRRAYEELFRPREAEPVHPWDEMEKRYNPVVWEERERARRRDAWCLETTGATKDAVDVVHVVYRTIRRIGRFFGDRSSLRYELGRGLPAPD